MTTKFSALLPSCLGFLLAAAVGACGSDGDSAAGEDGERSPIGKADAAAGSCEDRCGEFDFAEPCQCDELCVEIGDCCEDVEAVCGDGEACDPTLVCGQALTCVDGEEYPTTCGPANCDEPLGPCGDDDDDDDDDDDGAECDPTLVCGQAETCRDGELYPTTCGPDNCDAPIGDCDGGGVDCDPTLVCGQALTCVDGQEYPTTCGPANCDAPLGPC